MTMLLPFIVLLGFTAVGIPISFAIGIAALAIYGQIGVPPLTMITRMFGALDNVALLAIPFFVLAGEVMVRSRLVDEILDFANALLGHVRGGLAHVNVGASMMFSGISGSSVADVSAIGSVLIPAMEKQGYSRPFATAVTIGASAMGPIIPPSIIMIIYGHITGLSVGELFLGGIIPGATMALVMFATNHIICVRKGYDFRTPRPPLSHVLRAFVRSLPGLLMPIIVVGGILSGLFTATEGSAVAVAYALLYGLVIRRSIAVAELGGLVLMSARISGAIMLVIAFSMPFADGLARVGFQGWLLDTILATAASPWLVFVLMNFGILILGFFIDATAIAVMLGATFFNVLVGLGFNPLHASLAMILAMVIGAVTPPVGVALFTGVAIGKVSMQETVPALLPYLVALLVALLLVMFVPQLTLWVPGLFGAR